MWSNKKHGSTNKRADMTYKDYKDRDNLVKKDVCAKAGSCYETDSRYDWRIHVKTNSRAYFWIVVIFRCTQPLY